MPMPTKVSAVDRFTPSPFSPTGELCSLFRSNQPFLMLQRTLGFF